VVLGGCEAGLLVAVATIAFDIIAVDSDHPVVSGDARDEPLSDERSAPIAALLEAQTAVGAAIEKLAVEPAGLDAATADLLVRLYRSPACGIRGVEIGQQCLMTATRVSRLVDRAEAAGLVERTPDPDDRRAQHVALTKAGREAARRYAPLLDEVLDAVVFETLSAGERATLIELLERVSRRARDLLRSRPAG
jgi:DNA-binding MarR family transcriptional regulator